MFRLITLILLLNGCASMSHEEPEVLVGYKYNIGDCVYLVDPANDYKGDTRNTMKVTSIRNNKYYYRWWLYQGGWSLDENTAIGQKSTFERFTKPINCPAWG